MSLTRLYNDEKLYTRFVKESQGPGNYRLERDFKNGKLSDPGFSRNQCYIDNKNIRLQKTGVGESNKKSIIDIDSDLRNLTRPLSNDPDEQFQPSYNKVSGERIDDTRPAGIGAGSEVDIKNPNNFKLPGTGSNKNKCNFETNSYTRLNNPASNLKGTGINRWEWLCRNPQSNVFIPFRHNLNTTLATKDLYSNGKSPANMCSPK